MDLIKKYFPKISDTQSAQFEALYDVYTEWNEKINVISRKDIENLNVNHILHSLAIAKYTEFSAGSKILDLGTGGGFPGIPLAIMFPEVDFLLVDSVGKKLKVAEAAIEKLNLKNVTTKHGRVEELKGETFDFILTRAVASTEKLLFWTNNLYSQKEQNPIPNGLIALKGINLKEELSFLGKKSYYEITPISSYFIEEYFKEKCVLYVQA